MIYRNQREFEHIIQQLNSVQNIIQNKIRSKKHPQLHSTSEHPIINFFQSLGYNITPAASEVPDEIGYTQQQQPIGFELIKSPNQLVPHWSLEQAIQRSQDYGKIIHCVIITDGIFSQKDRDWARTNFTNVKLFDVQDLKQFSRQTVKTRPAHLSRANHNYTDQNKILQKLKQQIIHKRKQQRISQQRANQLKQAIQQIKSFIPTLTKFKNDFKKSAHQQDHFIHQLQKEFKRRKRYQKKLQSQQKAKNFRARLKAAHKFSSELMNLI